MTDYFKELELDAHDILRLDNEDAKKAVERAYDLLVNTANQGDASENPRLEVWNDAKNILCDPVARQHHAEKLGYGPPPPPPPPGPQPVGESTVDSEKNAITTMVLCLAAYFGVGGLHRFYVGKIGTGILMLVTMGGLWVWSTIDLVCIVVGKFRDSDKHPLRLKKSSLGVSSILAICLLVLVAAMLARLSDYRPPEPPPSAPCIDDPAGCEYALDLDDIERRRIQSSLRDLGYYTGAIDGLFGPGTRGAIRQWQRTQSGVATGYLDGQQAQVLMALARPSPPNDEERPEDEGQDGSRLVVRAEPDSRISIDGEARGVTNDAGFFVVGEMQAGEHVLVAEKDGYDTVTRTIEVERGRSDVVELALEASPGRLSVTANVDGAFVSVDGGELRSMPFDGVEVPSGVRQVTVARVGYDSVVEQVDVSPGELATIDVDLEPVDVEEDLPRLRQVFEAGNYELAVAGAQPLANLMELWEDAGIDVTGPFAAVQAILGRSFYELGRFEESAVPLYRAVLLGEEIVLPVNHRHGGGGFREGFCRGFLSMSLAEVAFRSTDDPDHGFAVPPQAVSRVQIAQRIQGYVFRVDTEIEGRGSVDFVHVNAQRQTRNPESGLVVDLVCPNCDRSLEVVQAILTRLSQS